MRTRGGRFPIGVGDRLREKMTPSAVEPVRAPDELREALDRVAKLEASLAPTTIASRLLRKIGPTRWFAAFYRRFGPLVDPWLLRKTGGRIATQVYGFPALLLISIGAKSGQPRTSPLLYARDGDDFLIVGTNFGTKNHPAWTGNLLANPGAEIVVGEDTLAVGAELVDEATFERLWPRFVAVYGGYDDYLKRLTHRSPRMFRLTPRH
jgi:deazaflavin-dependent oxidoreductase (nitroreductase family)